MDHVSRERQYPVDREKRRIFGVARTIAYNPVLSGIEDMAARLLCSSIHPVRGYDRLVLESQARDLTRSARDVIDLALTQSPWLIETFVDHLDPGQASVNLGAVAQTRENLSKGIAFAAAHESNEPGLEENESLLALLGTLDELQAVVAATRKRILFDRLVQGRLRALSVQEETVALPDDTSLSVIARKHLERSGKSNQ